MNDPRMLPHIDLDTLPTLVLWPAPADDVDRPDIFPHNFRMHVTLVATVGLVHLLIIVAGSPSEHTLKFLIGGTYAGILYMRWLLHKQVDPARGQWLAFNAWF